MLVVPLAPPSSGDAGRCRPVGYYVAADHLATRGWEGPMIPKQKMTRNEEHEFDTRPENHESQGPARRFTVDRDGASAVGASDTRGGPGPFGCR